MDLTFTNVAVKDRDEVFFAAIIDEYSDDHPDHCLVLRYYRGEFKQLLLDHPVCAIAVPSGSQECIGFVNPHGTVTFVENGKISSEIIDTSERGPSSRVLLRDAIWADDTLYTCGMARMVYARTESRIWSRIDHGVFLSREKRDKAVGFHAMAGNPLHGLVCVGQYGEIWSMHNSIWIQQDSPTNVTLTGVYHMASGDFLIVGISGVLIVGRDFDWRIIENHVTSSDFWGVVEFAGSIYVSNYDGVFRLTGENIEKIDIGLTIDEMVPSTAYLSSNNDIIWSVGHKHIAYSFDGVNWDILDFKI